MKYRPVEVSAYCDRCVVSLLLGGGGGGGFRVGVLGPELERRCCRLALEGDMG